MDGKSCAKADVQKMAKNKVARMQIAFWGETGRMMITDASEGRWKAGSSVPVSFT